MIGLLHDEIVSKIMNKQEGKQKKARCAGRTVQRAGETPGARPKYGAGMFEGSCWGRDCAHSPGL
jgi:hypothetical protein